MAKTKKPRAKKTSKVFQDCGGSCKITDSAVRTRTVATPPGFDYTTPNAINPASPIKPRTRTAREASGCKFEVIEVTARKGQFKDQTIKKKIVTDTRAECQDASKPCAGERAEKGANCPVQLFFRRGQSYLRFCAKKNTPGFIKPVKSAAEAQRLAAEACRCWLENGKSFKNCKLAVGTTLGGVKSKGVRRRRPKRQRGTAKCNLAELTEAGVHFATGRPVAVKVTHRKQKTANYGSQYGQDVEPHGRYVIHGHHGEAGASVEPGNHAVETSHDIVHFKKPLVVKHDNWKRCLAEAYGKKGRALSLALKNEGYDGIVTIDSYGTSEIVDLTSFRGVTLGSATRRPRRRRRPGRGQAAA